MRNMMGRHSVSLAGFATDISDYVVLFGGDCAADGSVDVAEGTLGRCSIAVLARSGVNACFANCGVRRDLCIEQGLLLPSQCVQEFNRCTADCEERPPTINTRVGVVPSSDPGRFNIEIDGSRVASNLRNGQETGPKPVAIGRHVVSQAAGSGTSLSNYARSVAGACSSDGSILIAGGEHLTCTVTNRGPQLMVRAKVEPAGDPGRFHLDVDGVRRRSNATNGSTTGFLSLSAGSHSVRVTAPSSTDLADYTVSFGQACSSTGQVSLVGGDKKICEARIKAKSGRAACLASCQVQRDICMDDDFLLPSQCVQLLNRCNARCPS